jgi:hypothetical protein
MARSIVLSFMLFHPLHAINRRQYFGLLAPTNRSSVTCRRGTIMEFFTAPCLCKARVSIDGVYQGESKDGRALHVFQCVAGLHDITMEYQNGGPCQRQTKRVMITGTTRTLPMEIPFICEL